MRKPISPDSRPAVRVVLITLDNHIAAAVDDARLLLREDLPGLVLSVHAATDWADHPDRLEACREAIRTGDIIIVSMIFVEEHVRAIADALEARHRDCDAMVCCMSAGTIMKYTSMGRFRMDGPQTGPLALLKKLRGGSSGNGRDSGRTAGERQMAMLRRLPKLLKFIPGTAQDVRTYFLTLQYRIAASDRNIANMVRLLVGRYAAGERKALRGRITAAAPEDYPEIGLYHPRMTPRILSRTRDLPRPARPEGSIGLLLLRTYILSGDTGHYDAVIAALEARGLSVVPVFCSGLDMRAAIEAFMTGADGRPTVDALCSLTGFSLVGGPAYSDPVAAARTLEALDVPYMAACVTEFQTREGWQASTRGLTPIETTLMVAIPELDGATGSMVIGGRSSAGDTAQACICARQQGACPSGRACMRPDDERVGLLADRLAALVRLRRTPRADRRLAVTLFNFPPNGGNIGTAAFLSVFESLFETMRRLRAEGYDVEVPADAATLQDMLLNGNAARHGTEANVHVTVAADDHLRQEPHLADIEAQWGPAPGRVLSNGRGLHVLGRQFGKLLVGIQPPFGYEGDPMRLLFEGGFAPNHAFAAYYTYLRKTYGAHAVLHFGTHGALEFMPGKHTGLSGTCWPDRLLGPLPNYYLYAANNPSEGSIAKRRSAATLISYLTPSVTEAGLYKGLQGLKASLDHYRGLAPGVDAERERLLLVIRSQAEQLGLTSGTQDLTTEAFVLRLVAMVTEMEYALIPDGLHVIGRGMGPRERAEMLQHMATGLSAGTVALPDPALLASIAAGDSAAVTEALATLDPEARQLVGKLVEIDRNLSDNRELDGLVRALDARFVPPSPSGDLLRTPDLLPTGRNIHGFDPFGIPSKFAQEDGMRQAALVLERHMQADGRLPETVAMVLWGTDNLKTGGAPLAQALALMGARPRLDAYNRVCGAELIPLEELKRPRIDAVMTLSGIFRDLLPIQASMLAEASYLAATADEPETLNFIRKHALAYCAAKGCDLETAAYRVFSNADGTYGANVNMLITSSAWSDDDEIADTYTSRKSFAISRKGKTSRQTALLDAVLADVDMAYQNLESVEIGVTTIEHYFDTLGGLSKAVSRAKGGAELPVYISDQTQGEARVRTLAEQVALETRTRTLNPKWYEGMLKHGYEGVRNIEASVTNTLGWSATTGGVEPWIYQQITETYVLDAAMRRRLSDLNPAAAARVAARLLEAQDRNFWQPDAETLAALRKAGEELEDRLEGLVTEAAE
ncbi:magnesium chelatase subunit H [Pannonibacter tanglangensis]|uniref:magnesium chelatase n=1 Tax=Pannonibacter tanglangensis TaxID=2750084 RepID=A0ABW9ZE52_9HYPH|nr:magnesium chelatase subunit H [Pannonibacter sp. XCT-34]NBN63109.1 magnesium chelatase subunit H [Pannonibacter sp. XCT-34]